MAVPNVQRAVLFESCLYCGGGTKEAGLDTLDKKMLLIQTRPIPSKKVRRKILPKRMGPALLFQGLALSLSGFPETSFLKPDLLVRDPLGIIAKA